MQATIQSARRDAIEWARGLKMKEAAADVAAFPVVALGYILGWILFVVKYVVGLFVAGFRRGARMS